MIHFVLHGEMSFVGRDACSVAFAEEKNLAYHHIINARIAIMQQEKTQAGGKTSLIHDTDVPKAAEG